MFKPTDKEEMEVCVGHEFATLGKKHGVGESYEEGGCKMPCRKTQEGVGLWFWFMGFADTKGGEA